MKRGDVIHILVTSLCDRNCPHCCNKQYDLNDIPYVTPEELRNTDTICLTGGEPFLFTQPSRIAFKYKEEYPNIKNVYVYGNAFDLACYIRSELGFCYIDGVTVSIKNRYDKLFFENVVAREKDIREMKSNLLYVFDGYEDTKCPRWFTKKKREWQERFIPAPNSIFRKA